MSVRATYTFYDTKESYNVYVHCDNSPPGALNYIIRALNFSYALPRFEAAEFAAGFIAAVKTFHDEWVDKLIKSNPYIYKGDKGIGSIKIVRRRGNIYLLPNGEWKKVSPIDIDFHYDVSYYDNDLYICMYTVYRSEGKMVDKLIFSGNLSQFKQFTEQWAKDYDMAVV